MHVAQLGGSKQCEIELLLLEAGAHIDARNKVCGMI
jgi:hypothetical protein